MVTLIKKKGYFYSENKAYFCEECNVYWQALFRSTLGTAIKKKRNRRTTFCCVVLFFWKFVKRPRNFFLAPLHSSASIYPRVCCSVNKVSGTAYEFFQLHSWKRGTSEINVEVMFKFFSQNSCFLIFILKLFLRIFVLLGKVST